MNSKQIAEIIAILMSALLNHLEEEHKMPPEECADKLSKLGNMMNTVYGEKKFRKMIGIDELVKHISKH